MKKILFPLLLAAMIATPAIARDSIVTISFKDLMETALAKEKLDGSVRFYLAGAPTPKVIESKGKDSTNKSTNGFNKSAERGCEIAAISALIALENKAKSLGANAVVEMTSTDKNGDFSSPTEFHCHDGAIISRVVLKGTYAKVAP